MDNTYIRYSEAYKRKVVREVESGRFSSMHAASKALTAKQMHASSALNCPF